MEKGSMRLEANISVRQKGQKELPKYKIEVKNVNSFRFIKKAIEFEFDRQITLLDSGNVPAQETRGFNEDKGETFSQRSKEDAHDYRYFPEPDIPPLHFTDTQIDAWRNSLPKLPGQVRGDLISRGVSQEKATILVSDPDKLDMITKLVQKDIELTKAVDMIINSPSDISGDLDKIILWAKQKETISVSTAELAEVAAKVVAANPKAVLDYKAGKEQSLFYLVGLIKRQLGNIDISQVRQAILDLIK
jgi:aspartyl-tRNA(Asn)/glutamyl-tRNA(Gln) amidotransferase subunit B